MNNIIQTIRHTARAAAVLLIALLAAQTAGAEEAVTYIDMDGKTKTVTEYTEVTTDMTADGNGNIDWSSGTYVVKSSVTLNGCIRYSGEVIDLIVCDGATLTVNGTSNGAFDGNTLNIYAQSNGTGMGVVNAKKNTSCGHLNIAGGKVTLDADGKSYGLYFFDGDASGLTVNGGDVTIQNSNDNFGAIYFNGRGFVTLNGGKLTVTNSMGNGYTAIEGQYTNTINFNGGTAVINGRIRDFNNINLNGGNVTVNGEIYKRGGYTVTYDFTRATDSYYINAFSNNLSSYATRTVQVKDGVSFRCNGNSYSGTLSADEIAAIAGKTLRPMLTGSGTTDDPYLISNATGWDVFCELLEENNQGFFDGKTVQLGADIGTADDPVTRMAGASGKDFTGTFDGQGNTLTVNYANTDNNVMTAPFSYVDGATIRNLIVDGSITGSAYRAAGVIGETGTNKSYITNCVSSVTISGDRYTGGFSIGGNVAIEGCVFNGKINATSRSGGFIGHSNSAQVIKNSLFAPKDGSSISGGTFYYNGDGDVAPVNSYYTRTLGTAQGKALHSVTAGDDVTLALSGTATKYTVSGITAYEGNQGIKYGTTYYAGSGDEVSLTLSNTGAPLGYQYGYTASAGTLIGSTLTMPAEDVTVSVNTAVLTAIPWDGDGTEGSPYIIKYASQLDLLAYRVNGTHGETRREDGYENKFFQLAKDISYTHTSDWDAFDSDESNFEAIGGYYDDDDRSFSGHFDGNNKTISGIRIHKDGIGNANMFQGIFGLTGSGADIHDLTLANARITGYDYTGGIVGYNDGATVTHCHVAGDVAVCAVQSYAHYHGGIAGNNDGTIEQCTSAANLTIAGATSAYYGGIAGINYGTLSDNLAIGATVPAAAYNTYGAITGSNGGTLQRNYYANCKVANTENATGVGCGDISDGNGGYIVADVNNDNNPDGAVSINTLALTANQAPDGNYWTTYYNGALGFTIDDDEHACAYTATYDAGQLTLHKLGKEIPAGTAVIIVAENNVVSMTATTILPAYSGTNDLRGVDVDTDVADIRNDLGDGTFYVLGMTTVGNEKHFGFHRYTGEEMAAHKAFVLVDSQSAARSLTMVFDEASGISDATRLNNKEEIKNNNWFTLDGRRLQAKPTAPGIYVNNGKKVVIK